MDVVSKIYEQLDKLKVEPPDEVRDFLDSLMTKKKNREKAEKNIKRWARQIQLFSIWASPKYRSRGTVEAVTGFGKTMIGVLTIAAMNRRVPNRVTHIIVPTEHLKKQWEGIISAFGLTGCEVFIINTYVTSKHACNLLIADEIHNYAAPTFKKLFDVCRYSFILGLTATIQRKDGKHILLEQFAPILGKVSLAEARRDEYISDFIVYNLGIELDKVDRDKYNKLHKLFNSMYSRFDHDFNLAMACSAGKAKGGPRRCTQLAYRRGWRPADGNNDFWSPQNISKYAQQWNWAMRERKKFLHKAASKVDVAEEILRKHKGKAITFSESTEFADTLAARMGSEARAYHSSLETIVEKGKKKGKTVRKREALKLFNDGRSKVRVLCTARALDEGFDVQDIDLAIVCSGTSTVRQNIQRIGRAVRFVPGKTAIIVNLYIKDTQDAKWLRKRTATTVNMIHIDDTEQITGDRATNKPGPAPVQKPRPVLKISSG